MCCAACARDEDAEAPAGGRAGVLEHELWRAMGADHARLMGHTELAQNLDCCAHGGIVTFGAHDDADQRRDCCRRHGAIIWLRPQSVALGYSCGAPCYANSRRNDFALE